MYKFSQFTEITKYLCGQLRKFSLSTMAKSRYEYVKDFETEDRILPNTWIVVRIDGKGFHRFVKHHDFEKPNDINALNLMNHAAQEVMDEFRDIVLSYGQSDEYSFVLRREAMVYNRRASKILTYITSYFTSSYVFNWGQYFPNKKLQYPPSFDGRVVLYPTDQNLRDYLSWRQADVHVNNLYNTAFWALVEKNSMSPAEAEKELRGTLASDKNEILFSQFNTNYNTINPMFRKGTILIRKRVTTSDFDIRRQVTIPLYEDMIREKFWKENPEILGKYVPGDYDFEMKENGCINIPDLVSKQFQKMNVDGDGRETFSKKAIET